MSFRCSVLLQLCELGQLLGSRRNLALLPHRRIHDHPSDENHTEGEDGDQDKCEFHCAISLSAAASHRTTIEPTIPRSSAYTNIAISFFCVCCEVRVLCFPEAHPRSSIIARKSIRENEYQTELGAFSDKILSIKSNYGRFQCELHALMCAVLSSRVLLEIWRFGASG